VCRRLCEACQRAGTALLHKGFLSSIPSLASAGTLLASRLRMGSVSMTRGTVRNSAALASAFVLALACVEGQSDQDQDASNELNQNGTLHTSSGGTVQVVAGCEDVLVPHATLPYCEGPAACEQVRHDRERVVRWRLILRRFLKLSEEPSTELSQEVIDHERDCVFRQLESMGLVPVPRDPTSTVGVDDVLVNASFEQVESVLYTTAVNSIVPSCVDAACKHCTALNELDCRADAFCVPLDAAHIDRARSCAEVKFAACAGPTDRQCDDSASPATSSDGSCWLFSGGCEPPGYHLEVGTQKPSCNTASFATLPQCNNP